MTTRFSILICKLYSTLRNRLSVSHILRNRNKCGKSKSIVFESERISGNIISVRISYLKTGRRGKDTVSKRNERERRRVRLISEGFGELRKHLMIQPCHRKLPKLQILRKAILYIQNLEDMIRESDSQNASAGNRLTECLETPVETPVTLTYMVQTLQLKLNKPLGILTLLNFSNTVTFPNERLTL